MELCSMELVYWGWKVVARTDLEQVKKLKFFLFRNPIKVSGQRRYGSEKTKSLEIFKVSKLMRFYS